MPAPLSHLKNPEFLAATIAAMRLLSGEREPRNQSEREILADIQSSQLKPKVANRIIAAFDAKPQADRQRLLGQFADKNYALESTAPSAPPNVVVRDHRTGASSDGTTGSASTSRVGRAGRAGEVGPLSEDVTTGTVPGIRYTVRYKGLWCQEETNGPGSDEIYIITSGLAINNEVNVSVGALTHPINTHDNYYGDVDSLEERVGPVAVVYTGSPDTLSLAVVVMEHDEGDPDYYRDEIDTFVKAAIAVAGKLWTPAVLLAYFEGNIVDVINWIFGTGDDVITTEIVTWERPALEALAIQAPSFYQGTKRPSPFLPAVNVQTGLLVHFVTKHNNDGAKYVVGFDIERDPPRPDPVIL